jgi:hypothetical protein
VVLRGAFRLNDSRRLERATTAPHSPRLYPATASAAGESEAGSRALGELAVEDPDRGARRLGLCLEQVSELRDGARGKLRSSRRKHPLAACVCGWGCSC